MRNHLRIRNRLAVLPSKYKTESQFRSVCKSIYKSVCQIKVPICESCDSEGSFIVTGTAFYRFVLIQGFSDLGLETYQHWNMSSRELLFATSTWGKL